MKDPKGEAARWLAQAEYDLRAAQSNADSKLYPYACFIAQQAAEKALKAFLYGQGEREVMGHSVAALCKRAARFNKVFSTLSQKSAKLDRLYIPTRYPNGLPDGTPSEAYDEEDSQSALEQAKEILDLVKKLL
jgi:HEPN domain-containing protein